MTPTLIGYFPKRTGVPVDWRSTADGVSEICSVSTCLAPAPEGWIDLWRHNALGVFDSPKTAESLIPDRAKGFSVFAYRLFPEKFADGARSSLAIEPVSPEPLSPSFRSLGLDVVSKSVSAYFECSPLSCNYLAKEIEVNQYCARAAALGLESLITVHEADLNDPIPFETNSFDAVMALDMVLHLRDRAQLFREVARTLASGRRFLFTDAGVVTGSMSNQEARERSVHGYTQFVAPGFNERILESSGFRLLETEDRTASVLKNAAGRLAGMSAHRAELEKLKGINDFERQQRYLQTVTELSRRGAVSRMMYLAESRVA